MSPTKIFLCFTITTSPTFGPMVNEFASKGEVTIPNLSTWSGSTK